MGLTPDYLRPKRPDERSHFEQCQSAALQTLFAVYSFDYVRAFPTLPHTLPMHQTTYHTLLAPDLIVSKTPISLIESMETVHDRMKRLQHLRAQTTNPRELYIIDYMLEQSPPVFRPVKLAALSVSHGILDTWHYLVDQTLEHTTKRPPVRHDKRVIVSMPKKDLDCYLDILRTIGVSIGFNSDDTLSWSYESRREDYSLYLVYKRPEMPISDATNALIAHPHWYECIKKLEGNLSKFQLQPVNIYNCFEGGINSGVYMPTFINLYLKDDYNPKDVHLASTMNLDDVGRFQDGLVRPYRSYKRTDTGNRLKLDYKQGESTCPAGYGPSQPFRNMLTAAGYQTGPTILNETANPNGPIQQNILAELQRFVTWYQEYWQTIDDLTLAPGESHLLGLTH